MKKKDISIGVLVICFGIFLDQVIKYFIRVKLAIDQVVPFIKHFIYFTHVENTGAAWSSFSGKILFLVLLSLVILGYFIYLFKDINYKEKPIFSISLTLVISGTIGNLIDRIFFKSVTDFISVELFGWDSFPVFNFADILLVVGFFLFIVHLLFIETYKNNKTEKLEENNVNYVSNDLEVSNKEMIDSVNENNNEDSNSGEE